MAIKDILVFLGNSPHSVERLDLAIQLAQQHQANITGLHVVAHMPFEVHKSSAADEEAGVQKCFLDKCNKTGVSSTWQHIDVASLMTSVAEVVIHHARFVDLVIVGQTEYDAKEREMDADLPERIVLGSGKPVLIVPYAVTFSSLGNRVLVACTSGRESARVIADSLPMLKKADLVTVFEVNPSDDELDDMEKLCDHLAHHGIQAKAERSLVTKLSIGDVLLNRAADEGSDLLVMGAFAHTHFGAYLLGDAAKHVLKYMTVPVLMSH